MLAILTKIWTFLSSKAAEWLGIGAVVLSVLALVRKSGADSVRNSEMKETLKDIGIKSEIHEEVNRMSDDQLDNELRK